MKRDPTDLFAAVMAVCNADIPPKRRVVVVREPKNTTNLFGPIEEVAGKELAAMEINFQGDALCFFKGGKGWNLVDVDHTDIEKIL
jgi:hypothetical protein